MLPFQGSIATKEEKCRLKFRLADRKKKQRADPSCRWHDAIRTIAKLHRVDARSVGLSNFGKSSGFYDRQIKTLSAISASQSHAVDIETEVPVGKIPHFDDMVAFFKDPVSQPKDRATLIHGDYKIDNLVYHRTEPRVIGILEYVFSPPPPCLMLLCIYMHTTHDTL